MKINEYPELNRPEVTRDDLLIVNDESAEETQKTKKITLLTLIKAFIIDIIKKLTSDKINDNDGVIKGPYSVVAQFGNDGESDTDVVKISSEKLIRDMMMDDIGLGGYTADLDYAVYLKDKTNGVPIFLDAANWRRYILDITMPEYQDSDLANGTRILCNTVNGPGQASLGHVLYSSNVYYNLNGFTNKLSYNNGMMIFRILDYIQKYGEIPLGLSVISSDNSLLGMVVDSVGHEATIMILPVLSNIYGVGRQYLVEKPLIYREETFFYPAGVINPSYMEVLNKINDNKFISEVFRVLLGNGFENKIIKNIKFPGIKCGNFGSVLTPLTFFIPSINHLGISMPVRHLGDELEYAGSYNMYSSFRFYRECFDFVNMNGLDVPLPLHLYTMSVNGNNNIDSWVYSFTLKGPNNNGSPLEIQSGILTRTAALDGTGYSIPICCKITI